MVGNAVVKRLTHAVARPGSKAVLPNAVAAKKARRASATLNSSRLTSSAVTYTRIKLLSL